MAAAAEPSKGEVELTAATLTKAQRRKLQDLCQGDERTATAGVLNMLLTVVVAVRWPGHYWAWHAVRTSFYVPVRYLRFRGRGWELYLLDWCYVVTYLSTAASALAFLRVTFGVSTPLVGYNADLIRAGFAMACGPLAWSVFVFRNSIVFHDVDHATSVFIHLSPFVLFWCLRWGAGVPSVIEESWPGMFKVCQTKEDFAAADVCFETTRGMLWCGACASPPSAFVVPPALVYLCAWSVPYYLVVLVRWRRWCERTGRETLYSYFAQTRPDLLASLAGRLEPLVGRRNSGPAGYMLLHFASMIGLCSTAYLLWHSFFLHTLLMVIILAKAVHNGSTFMFRVFAYRYVQECLEKHKKELQ